MKRNESPVTAGLAPHPTQWIQALVLAVFMAALATMTGCAGKGAKGQTSDFFTSGNRDADQRASQKMAQAEQLSGSGEGAGESGSKKKSSTKGEKEKKSDEGKDTPVKVEGKRPLFDRLGGEAGLSSIVEDFVPRVLQDPRVNWERKGLTTGGFFHHKPSVTWQPTPDNIAKLKKHFVQFLALATGGPAHYEGKEMKSVHAGMQISNPEFDAAIGDLKASLDRLKIANTEQKELLAIAESTRPEIVTQR